MANSWVAIGPGAAAFAMRQQFPVLVDEVPDDVTGDDLTVFVCGSTNRDGPRRLARDWLKQGAASVLLHWVGGETEVYH
jgi:hypothetical protein